MHCLTLRDGTEAVVWPLLPTDGRALQESFARLSGDSRYRRFLSSTPRLSAGMLRSLVDDVDGRDHVALVLVVFPADACEEVAGVARIVRYRQAPQDADVAVTVADHWQGHGVASALLADLVRQRPAGVRRLVTQVAADNPGSLAMLRRLGPTWTGPASAGAQEVRVELAEAGGP